MGLKELVPPLIREYLRPLKDPVRASLSWILRAKSGNRILSGPFAGMAFRYPQQEYAMLLGTWELELATTWEKILAQDFNLMVDVGAAEGYYAVGMAYRKPGAKVVAFEMNGKVRENLRILNELNDAQLDIRGKCEVGDLVSFGQRLEGAFILMDVEGYETVLLDPSKVPSLSRATILVELHDMYAEGCTELLGERFRCTHKIKKIEGIPRHTRHFSDAAGVMKFFFSKRRALGYMDEGRPSEMSWYYMVPKGEEV